MRSLSLLTLAMLFACAPAVEDDKADGGDKPDTDTPADSAAPDTDGTADTDGADTSDDTDAPDTDPPATTDLGAPTCTGPATLECCFGALWDGPAPVDYASAGATLGQHCKGTNHQDIQGVQRVVFIGDSITMGTPPTPAGQWYRNRLARELATRFGLQPPSPRWTLVDPISGNALETFSGDFANCSKWGARTDDLIDPPHQQMKTCMPEEDRDLVTLVVMSIGGNDIFSFLEDINAGVEDDKLREAYDKAVSRLEAAVRWVKEPGRFPNGVFVVFTNTFDFSDADGAEDMAACDGAELINLSPPLREPILHSVIADAQARYLKLAVETGTDMVFFGEAFCGHGWNTDDTTRRCYRGPGAATYTDFTCEHPNGTGHAAIADLVLAVVDE
ncbi:MAG: hypothetical protein H6732_16105 [Alphaproteobacteria bacterium]|nr:hypothetical protein [Alphaproteobacteria bacterium]